MEILWSPMSIGHCNWPIRYLLNSWWQMKPTNIIHKLVLQVLPVIIFWEIWKESCACKYGNQKRFKLFKMEQHSWTLQLAINNFFPLQPDITLDQPLWQNAESATYLKMYICMLVKTQTWYYQIEHRWQLYRTKWKGGNRWHVEKW